VKQWPVDVLYLLKMKKSNGCVKSNCAFSVVFTIYRTSPHFNRVVFASLITVVFFLVGKFAFTLSSQLKERKTFTYNNMLLNIYKIGTV
jgi:hypothetical protein